MQISQLWADTNKQITIIGSKANATAIGIMNSANIQAFQYTQSKQATALKNLGTTLNMTSADLLNYLKVRTIKDKDQGKIVVGMDKMGSTAPAKK